MQKLLSSAAFLGFLLTASIAIADDVDGTIKTIDTENGMLVLSDGSQFHIPDEFNIDGLDPGQKVVVFFDMIDGKKTLADIDILD
ncbi:MAG: DUF1344 domain-containing protein [Hyphomicrobiales bacterium]|nr:DUF1344 domain-containing protein [Hyphomicrobiales bacterium]